MLKASIGGYMAPPTFVEKTFAGGSKTAKFVNVLSLESFPVLKRFLLFNKSNNMQPLYYYGFSDI